MNSELMTTEANSRQSRIDINVEDFVTEVYHRPSIWRSSHSQYRNQQYTKLMWEEIKRARFPEYEIAVLKKKWKSLKNGFRTELRKNEIVLAENANAEDYELSQWKYFNILAFLKDELETDNFQDEDPDESTSSPSQPEPREEDNQKLEAMAIKMQSEPKKIFLKRTLHTDIRAEYLEIERKKLKILEQEVAKQNNTDTEKSEDYHYFMSILPEMQKLTAIQKMRVRNKINQVLMDEMVLNTYEETPVRAHNACDDLFVKEEPELI